MTKGIIRAPLTSLKLAKRVVKFIGQVDGDTGACLASYLANPLSLAALPHIPFPPPHRDLFCVLMCNHYAVLSVRNGTEGRVSKILTAPPPEFSGWPI